MLKFLAFGNLTLDDLVTAEAQIALDQLGGAALYTAAGIRLWGESVGLISVVGVDFPEEHLDTIAASGIDISGLERLDIPHGLRSRAFYFKDGSRSDRLDEVAVPLSPDVESLLGSKSRYSDYGSRRHRKVWPKFSPSPAQIKPQHLKARFAHLAPGPTRNNRLNALFLKRRTEGQITLALDWPWWSYDDPTLIDAALLGEIDFLLPSREELVLQSGYTEEAGLLEMAENLLSFGPDGLVLKQGSRGAAAFKTGWEKWIPIPIYTTKAIDPTGAGDAFCGGFLVGMARTGNIVQAAQYGSVSASFIIEDFGVIHALQISSEQAEARLGRYLSQVNSNYLERSKTSA